MADSPMVQKLLAMKQDGKLESPNDFLELSKQSFEGKLEEITLSNLVEEYELLELGRLDWSPRKNWVENEGGLPRYIEEVAIGIMKGSGYPREKAIPIAISRIKKWAAGLEGVKRDTQAKAIAALASWEKMKASARAKRLKK